MEFKFMGTSNPERTVKSLSSSIEHKLEDPDDPDFFLITTTEGAWTKQKAITGVAFASITSRVKQEGASWDAERLVYKIKLSDIDNNQTAILFRPGEIICTDAKLEEELTQRFAKELEETDNNLFEIVVDEASEEYKRNDWKPQVLSAVVAQRKGNKLFTSLVLLDSEDGKIITTPLKETVFENGEAIIGEEIYLTPNQARERQYFNERYGSLMILRPSTREELEGGQ